jgi:hypothetical protein
MLSFCPDMRQNILKHTAHRRDANGAFPMGRLKTSNSCPRLLARRPPRSERRAGIHDQLTALRVIPQAPAIRFAIVQEVPMTRLFGLRGALALLFVFMALTPALASAEHDGT